MDMHSKAATAYISAGAALVAAAALYTPPESYRGTQLCLYGLAWLFMLYQIGRAASFRRDMLCFLFVLALSIYPFGARSIERFTVQTLYTGGILCLIAGMRQYMPLPVIRLSSSLVSVTSDMSAWLWKGLWYSAFLSWTVFLSGYCFGHLPTIIDTVSQYVHAKFIAEGQLYGESPPLPKFFDSGLMLLKPHWYSQYQPLHVILLGIGHALHSPWLVNPTVGALTLLVTYQLALRCAGSGAARIAIMLLALSPFVWFMSAEYMNHATAMLCTALFLLASVETFERLAQDKEAAYLGFASGLALGLLFLTRPLCAVEYGLPVAIYALFLLPRSPSRYAKALLAAGGGLGLCGAFQLWYDWKLTGDAFLMPYLQYHDTNMPGFNRNHSLLKGILKAQDEWRHLNSYFFGWPAPALLALIPLFTAPRNRYINLLLAILVCATLANMVNRFPSMIFGPRYLYESSCIMAVLGGAGIARLPDWLKTRYALREAHGRTVTLAICALLYAGGWCIQLPEMLAMYKRPYFEGNHAFYNSMMKQARPPALVFIERVPVPSYSYTFEKYLYVAHSNPPRDEADVIFAIDYGEQENARLRSLYPSRRAYVEREGLLWDAGGYVPPSTLEKQQR